MNQERIVETNLRVRYAETDAMGVVYHAEYLVWFEVGRGEFFRSLGQDYGQWEQEGHYLPVSEAYARYLVPARYGEKVTVRTRLEEVRSRSLTLRYKVVLTENQRLLASGWTKHICMNAQGRACRLPADMLALLEQP